MSSLPDLILPNREFFGLSIDRTSLRGVQLERSGKVKGIAEVVLPPDVFSRSILVKGEVFLANLQQLLKLGKFTTPYVVVCFPEAFAYTRELKLPHVAISELTEAVGWHVKELFPFPEEDLYVDWKIIRSTEKEYELAVVAVPKKTVDPIINSLLSAGLKPLRFQPDASTIARLLGLTADKHAIVTEVNKSVSYVTLVEGEKAVFTTVVPFTADDTPQLYLGNVKQTIEEISAFYRKKGMIKENTIDIVLTGEIANDSWVKELPHPAKILMTPLRNPSFNKAYATAMSQKMPLPLDEDSINLLPTNLQKVYIEERNNLYYQTILFRGVSVVGAYLVMVILVFFFIAMERQRLDAEVKRLNAVIQAQNATSHNLLSVNGTAKQIVALAPLRKTPRDVIATFLTLITDGIVINQWDYDDSKLQINISGVATTRDALLNFKSSLDNSQKFTKISLPLSFLESPENISFSMSFTLK